MLCWFAQELCTTGVSGNYLNPGMKILVTALLNLTLPSSSPIRIGDWMIILEEKYVDFENHSSSFLYVATYHGLSH